LHKNTLKSGRMKKEQQRKGKPRKGASACNPPDSLPFSPLSLRPGQIYYHTHKARRKQNTIYIKMEKKKKKRTERGNTAKLRTGTKSNEMRHTHREDMDPDA